MEIHKTSRTPMPDGRIAEPPTVVEFPDDRAAIEAAEALLDGKDIEVWQAARVVIRLSASDASGAMLAVRG